MYKTYSVSFDLHCDLQESIPVNLRPVLNIRIYIKFSFQQRRIEISLSQGTFW